MTRMTRIAKLFTAVLIGTSISTMAAQSPAPSEITFSRDVAPILFEHCLHCHRPGEVAPFSMLTYAAVRPWARAIRQQVLTRRMPPWFLESESGSFQNSNELTEKELQILASWVDGGASEGKPSDMPPPPQFGAGWEIGTPDLVVKMTEPYRIPAGGVITQLTIPTDYVFAEDTWVEAIEVRPGNRRVVHQALALVGSSGLATSLHLYAPGLPATILREGYGRFIPKGTRIHLRMHYNTIGQETSDRTEVGFRLARKPVHTELRTGIADANASAANSPLQSHESFTTFPLSEDARIHAFRPHMATRGANAKATLVLPDGSRKTLLSIGGWSDNWEYSYVLSRPIEVPRGSVLEYKMSTDVKTPSGTATHFLYFDWTSVNTANRVDREPILSLGSPLFTIGVKSR
jgi:hypothetical protein